MIENFQSPVDEIAHYVLFIAFLAVRWSCENTIGFEASLIDEWCVGLSEFENSGRAISVANCRILTTTGRWDRKEILENWANPPGTSLGNIRLYFEAWNLKCARIFLVNRSDMKAFITVSEVFRLANILNIWNAFISFDSLPSLTTMPGIQTPSEPGSVVRCCRRRFGSTQ